MPKKKKVKVRKLKRKADAFAQSKGSTANTLKEMRNRANARSIERMVRGK